MSIDKKMHLKEESPWWKCDDFFVKGCRSLVWFLLKIGLSPLPSSSYYQDVVHF